MYVQKEDHNMGSVSTQIRIDSKVKEQASIIFKSLGLDMSSAVNIFLRYCIMCGGIPFEVRIPNYNAKVLAAMEEAASLASDDSAETFSDIDSLMKSLDSD